MSIQTDASDIKYAYQKQCTQLISILQINFSAKRDCISVFFTMVTFSVVFLARLICLTAESRCQQNIAALQFCTCMVKHKNARNVSSNTRNFKLKKKRICLVGPVFANVSVGIQKIIKIVYIR